MIRTPHPDLRRLYALGGVASRTADRLAGVLPDLSRLTSTRAETSLFDDEALQTLARAPNLSDLFANVVQSAPVASAVQSADQRTAGVPVKPARRAQRADTPARAPAGQRAASNDSDSADGSARVGILQTRSVRPHARGRSRLSKANLQAVDNAGARHTSMPANAATLARAAFNAAGDGVHPQIPGATHAALEAAGFVSNEVATGELRRRAERAGAATAADTPVSIGAASADVGALLDDVAASRTSGGIGTNASTVLRTPTVSVNTEPQRVGDVVGSARVLARVLERIPARAAAAKRERMRAESVGAAQNVVGMTPGKGASAVRDFELSNTGGDEAPTGLRRLLALHDGTEQNASAARKHELPPTPMSGVVAARLRDTELAEALDRLLRREARRQGVDLEGLGA